MQIIGETDDHGNDEFGKWHKVGEIPAYDKMYPHTEVDDALWAEYEQVRDRMYDIEEAFGEGRKKQYPPRRRVYSPTFQALIDACKDMN